MSRRHLSDTATPKPLRLPRLPVPKLRDTLDRYLKSLEPFLLEDEARGGPSFDEAMRQRVAWSDEFERGLGGKCQERLIELDKNSPDNWLDDNFWLNKAYLELRAPLVINSNWWLAYQNDRTVPADVVNGRSAETRAGISDWQIRRAAWLLKRTLEFKERFESPESTNPDTMRTGLWLQNTVPRMFNLSSPYRKKVLVMLHDWIYSMDAYGDGPGIIGHRQLERQLRGVVKDAEGRFESGERAVPVSVLTSDDRDRWAKNRSHLLNLSPTNRITMSVIEDSILSVNLDHYTYEIDDSSPSEMKSHMHNIRSGVNARNRWFDKGITLIVESNSRAGMTGEHSPVDALVPSIVADYSLAEDIDGDWSMGSFVSESVPVRPDGWERLNWVVDDYIQQECIEAEERVKAIIEDSDDNVYWFTEYGGDWINKTARLSVDAYIQMAMQVAWYRTQGEFTATYETALTRLFHHGRTDTIRTFSTDSRQFVLSMLDPNVSIHDKAEFLRKAVKTHSSLTKAATIGRGIDRHLLGLRLLMKPDESCGLFEDDFFTKSQDWKLSTSGLSAGEYFRGTGFGSPYHSGYGINYLAAPNMIKFGIESKLSCQSTSSDGFREAIFLSLTEMRSVMQSQSSASDDNPLRPRL